MMRAGRSLGLCLLVIGRVVAGQRAALVPPVLVFVPLQYPNSLQEPRISGTVRLGFIVDPTGHVVPESVSILASSDSGLDSDAVATVRQAVFRPAHREYRGVSVEDTLSLQYVGTDRAVRVRAGGAESVETIGSGDFVSVDVVEQKPAVLSTPPLQYPDSLWRAGVQGAVRIQAIVDTMGHIEPGSIIVMQPVHPVLDSIAVTALQGAVLQPGRVAGKAVRTLIEIPFQFSIKQ